MIVPEKKIVNGSRPYHNSGLLRSYCIVVTVWSVLETIADGGRKWNSEREVLPERYPDAWTDEPQDAGGQGWRHRSVCVGRTGLWQGECYS